MEKPTTVEELRKEETTVVTLVRGGRNVKVEIGRVLGPDFAELPALPILDIPGGDKPDEELTETERKRRASIPQEVLDEKRKQYEERIDAINRIMLERGSRNPRMWLGARDECPDGYMNLWDLKEVETDELIFRIMEFSGHRGLAKMLPFFQAQGLSLTAPPDGEGIWRDAGKSDGPSG